MIEFKKSSYLVQVRRLREMAELASEKFALKPKRISFINHGENTTFKVEDRNGRSYLLRIHRQDYHKPEAIMEEMRWLAHLSKDGSLLVPKPVKSKAGRLLEKVWTEGVGHRHCSLFHWLDGRFVEKGLNEKHMYQLGRLIAQLQTRTRKTKLRKYWDSEGLVGIQSKFGSYDKLDGISSIQRRKILSYRKKTFDVLKKYEKKNPHKMGLIHADLHFGNLLFVDGKIGAIDFDDCGYGFFAYDLAVSLVASDYMTKKGKGREKKLKVLQQGLFAGYRSLAEFSQEDEAIVDHLISARKLTMLCWLHSRSDNPRLRKHFKKAVKNTIRHFEQAR